MRKSEGRIVKIMSNQARYNRILFLTTLSVYMGLVLMGGASPALAQAAMAKSFELKSELEAKDDLDKKPDDKEEKQQVSQALDAYFNTSKWFLEDLQRLSALKKFDREYVDLAFGKRLASPCGNNKNVGVRELTGSTYVPNDILRPQLESTWAELVTRLARAATLSDCLSNNNPEWNNTSEIGIEVSHKQSGFELELSLEKHSPQRAQQLATALNFACESYLSKYEDSTAKVLRENTKITSENDQVFIITNLPRAGLDSLLAVK
jgi:hypothetical protein